MASYIEVAFLLNFTTNLLAIVVGCALTSGWLSTKHKLLYAFISALMGVLFFFEGSLTIMLLIELVLYVKVIRHSGAYLVNVGFRLLHLLTLLKVLDGTAYNLLFFPALHQSIIGILLLHLICLMALHQKWQTIFKMKTYIYEIKIENMKMKGYLDSGNSLMHEGLPVIVVIRKVYEKIKKEETETIDVHTLTNRRVFKGKKAMLEVHKQKREVFVVCSEEDLLMNVECLLNMKGVN